jgi:leucyl-tRNA synthetase
MRVRIPSDAPEVNEGIRAATRSEPEAFEPTWQRVWAERSVFTTPEPQADRTDVYVLVACPFTSGAAHLGHVRSYSIGDAYARYRRARGDAVLFSLGFDAFGLPTELNAIAHGLSPLEWVTRCAGDMRREFDRLGFSFDWARTFNSCDEDVYRWTQWLFLALLEAGLLHQREGLVEWCDSCETVLASRQVEDGRCWRCQAKVRLVRRTQWYLSAETYNAENDRRTDGLDGWNAQASAKQRALLGQVEGSELDATGVDGAPLVVFTPHSDAIPDAKFALMSPGHPDVERWAAAPEARRQLDGLRDAGWQRAQLQPDAVPLIDTGQLIHGPGVEQPLPVLISPSVDVRYGRTAVLGIPAADRTDAALGTRLPTKAGLGWRTKSRPLVSRPAVRYRISDFAISRQRAWGAPVPLVHCEACGNVPVPAEELPVRLPADIALDGTGGSLAERPDFVACECPACGRPARRDTDTLDSHADTWWQYLPLAVPDRSTSPFRHPEARRWLPVGMFIHGSDVGGFVLDQRTIAKALRDQGPLDYLEDGEPHGSVLMHGMVTSEGRKMSKQLGTGVAPGELIRRAGADAVRFAVLDAAAPAKSFDWNDHLLTRSRACLDRIWAHAEPRLTEWDLPSAPRIDLSDGLRRRLAAWSTTAVTKISENFDELKLHRVTRNVMLFLTRIEDFEARVLAQRGELADGDREAIAAALLILLQLLAPVAPHLGEELWARSGQPDLLAKAGWPDVEAYCHDPNPELRASSAVRG